MDKYLLQKSAEKPQWWILTDTGLGIVLQFKEGEFNESQKVTFLNDIKRPDPLKIARAVRYMGDWLYENHRELMFIS